MVIRTWTLAGALLLLLSCAADGGDHAKSDEPSAKSTGSGKVVLAEHTKVLDEEALAALSSFTHDKSDLIELVFSSKPSGLDDVAEGDVLVLGTTKLTPNGALLEVVSVKPRGSGLLVQANPAELSDAFEKLQIKLEANLGEPAHTSMKVEKRKGAPVSQLQQALELAFPITLPAGSGENRLDLDGSLAVDPSIDLNLDFDLASASLKELSLSFSGRETFEAEIVGHGQQSTDQMVSLGSIAFAPITVILPIPVPPGSVPVVLTPRVDLEAGVRGSIQGDVQASVRQEASFTAGLGYHDGAFEGFSDDDSDFDYEQPTFDSSANLKAWAGPRMKVLIYGAVGPFAGVDGFVELAAQAGGPPLCAQGTLEAGLSANAGMDFLLTYETTLFDKRYPLAQFDSCTNDPKAPKPAVTWARSYGRVGSPGERAKAVVQAPDDSYLVVGDSDLFDGVTGFAGSTWALRLDPLGNIIWQRAFQRLSQLGLTRGAAVVPDGFLVSGNGGVMKLDSGGNLSWAKTYVADELLEIASMAADADGSFVVAGYVGTDPHAWAMKLDESGEVKWAYDYGKGNFSRVRTTADGGYILIGSVDSNVGDMAVTKLDDKGKVVWARALDNRHDSSGGQNPMPMLSSGLDTGFDVVEKPGGGYVAVGESYGAFPVPEPGSAGFYAAWVVELDEGGEIAADGSTVYRAPSNANYGDAYAVGIRKNGNTVIVGRRADESTDLLGHEDVLVIQGGAFSTLGGPGNDAVGAGPLTGIGRGMPLQMTADDGAILAVTSDSFADQEQFWLIKLDRTASIRAPFRDSLSGSSYKTADAVSADRSSSARSIAVSAKQFASMIGVESTEIVVEQQSP